MLCKESCVNSFLEVKNDSHAIGIFNSDNKAIFFFLHLTVPHRADGLNYAYNIS